MTIKYLTQLPKPLFMTMLEEQAIASGMAKGLEQGLVQGLEQGIEKGLEQGIERGLERGLEQGLQRGMQQGMQQGFRASKLEDARKMQEHGIGWDVITDITGLKPEDLLS